jgi:hypothetical protein
VTSVYFKSGGGDFLRNAAEMFSFDLNPTIARKAWSSSTCLLYGQTQTKINSEKLILKIKAKTVSDANYSKSISLF